MLWTAGQERMTRERNARLAELFVTARDAALDVGVTTGQLTAKGSWGLPFYVRPDAEQRQAAAKRGLAQLMADFPGNVARGKEFVQ
jgi:hypothetical protein